MSGAARDGIDVPTVVGIAIVAYCVCNVIHEGVGHGLACVVAGGRPQYLNAIYFSCGGEMSVTGRRLLAAGGSVANVVAALLCLVGLRMWRRPGPTHYFLWLLFAIDVLMPSGYLLFSGIGGLGDWAVVVDGLRPALLFRAAVALAGGLLYFVVVSRWLRPGLDAYLGGDPARRRSRARSLTLASYLAGGITFVVAGLFNPASPWLILISAAAGSFGGTCWLAYYPGGSEDLRLASGGASVAPSAGIPRSVGWIVAGAVVAVVFIAVLGPGLRL